MLADTYYPGWQATVDGRPVELHRGNYLFRAVQVPAGAHTVRFEYRPRSFTIGLGLFVIGLSFLTVLMWRRF